MANGENKGKGFWQIVAETAVFVAMGVIALLILNYTTDIFAMSAND